MWATKYTIVDVCLLISPWQLLDAFFEVNNEDFFAFELIRSRSSFESILTSRGGSCDEPVLYGTEPPVSFDPRDPSADEASEDSFTSANLQQTAFFFNPNIAPLSTNYAVCQKHFIVIDEDTLWDGSIIIVELVESSNDCVFESEDEDYLPDDAQALERCSRRLQTTLGSPSENQVKIDAMRIAMDKADLVQTIEFTALDMHLLKMDSALDGVYWDDTFRGKDPPPIGDRF